MSSLARRAAMLVACTGLPALPVSSIAAAYTIDVLGIYSSHTAELVADPNALFVSHVEYANKALQNSGANYRYQLVHVQQQNWANDASLGSSQLSSFAQNATIQQLRDDYGADLVAGMVPSSGGLCGIAYLPSGDQANQTFYSWAKNYGYSLSGHNCGGRTMAHEIGHNMGLGHSAVQGSEGSLAVWGRGHGVGGSFVTIMAYGSAYNVYSAAGRIQIHSNPEKSSCLNQACGQPIDAFNPADATRALDLAAPQIADWRDAVISGPANNTPVAVNDSVTTDQGKPVTIDVLSNDSDPDGDTLSVSSMGNPANGKVEAQASQITYTPNDGFYGQDSFSYTIYDGVASASATVQVTVKQVVTTPPPGGGGGSGNLLVNGGAESGLTGWRGVWNAKLALSSDEHSGTKAVTASGGRGIFADLYTPFTGNGHFTVSVWLKATQANRVYLYARVKTNGRWRYRYISAVDVLADVWTPFERTHYLSGGTIQDGQILFYFDSGIRGEIHIDDVQYTPN